MERIPGIRTTDALGHFALQHCVQDFHGVAVQKGAVFETAPFFVPAGPSPLRGAREVESAGKPSRRIEGMQDAHTGAQRGL